MITLITEDGYKFYWLDDGRLVDSLDPDKVDMEFDNLAQFVEAMHS